MALTFRGRPVKFSLNWLKPPPLPEDGNMTLFEHLRELRYRLVIAALAMIVAMTGCAFFYNQLLGIMIHPFTLAREELQVSRPDLAITMTISQVSGSLTLAVKVVALAALLIASPVILYQVWAFVVPGLLSKEKKWALIFVGAAVPMFLAGVVLGYFVMPKGISVLLSFTPRGSDIDNLIDTNTFLSFLMRLMLVFGLAFLIPVIVLMLNFLGVVKAKWLAKFRVYIIFGTCVFGAVATPSTDPFSMLALAVPMTVLFLAAEIIATINDKRRAAKAGGDLEEYDTVLAQLQAEDKAEREARLASSQPAKVVIARRPPDAGGAGPTTITADPPPTAPTLAPAQAAAEPEPEPFAPDSSADLAALINDVPEYVPEHTSGITDTGPESTIEPDPEPSSTGGANGFDIDAFKSAITSAGSDSEPARR